MNEWLNGSSAIRRPVENRICQANSGALKAILRSVPSPLRCARLPLVEKRSLTNDGALERTSREEGWSLETRTGSLFLAPVRASRFMASPRRICRQRRTRLVLSSMLYQPTSDKHSECLQDRKNRGVKRSDKKSGSNLS